MSGELDLHRLLATLEPKLHPGEFVFLTVPAHENIPCVAHAIGTFREPEGLTLILPAGCDELPAAPQSGPQRMITLECHSSLEAIGLTYRVSQRLAQKDISCNVVAAYYHDHLFVSADKATAAVDALRALQAESKAAADEVR